MRPRPRLRTAAKWCGLVVSGALAAAWLGSVWAGVQWQFGPVTNSVSIASGAVHVEWDPWDFRQGWRFERAVRLRRHAAAVTLLPGWESAGSYQFIHLPLWIPLAAVGGVTVRVWVRDHQRSRRGSCLACGYSLAGLTGGGPCPECGGAAGAERA